MRKDASPRAATLTRAMGTAHTATVTALHADDARPPTARSTCAPRERRRRATCSPRSAATSPSPACARRRAASPRRSPSCSTPEPFSLTTFPNEAGYDELVVVRDIPFHSLCMHHLLPFHGVAHVAYLPGERIVGLSKLARVVELFARDLQLQERLTMQVADVPAASTCSPRASASSSRPSTCACRCAACRRPARGRRPRRCSASCATIPARARSSSRSSPPDTTAPDGDGRVYWIAASYIIGDRAGRRPAAPPAVRVGGGRPRAPVLGRADAGHWASTASAQYAAVALLRRRRPAVSAAVPAGVAPAARAPGQRRRAPLRPRARADAADARQLALVAALLVFASSFIHSAVIADHFEDYWLFGVFFAVVTVRCRRSGRC